MERWLIENRHQDDGITNEKRSVKFLWLIWFDVFITVISWITSCFTAHANRKHPLTRESKTEKYTAKEEKEAPYTEIKSTFSTDFLWHLCVRDYIILMKCHHSNFSFKLYVNRRCPHCVCNRFFLNTIAMALWIVERCSTTIHVFFPFLSKYCPSVGQWILCGVNVIGDMAHGNIVVWDGTKYYTSLRTFFSFGMTTFILCIGVAAPKHLSNYYLMFYNLILCTGTLYSSS